MRLKVLSEENNELKSQLDVARMQMLENKKAARMYAELKTRHDFAQVHIYIYIYVNVLMPRFLDYRTIVLNKSVSAVLTYVW